MSVWLASLACIAMLITSGCNRATEPPASVAIEQIISPNPARVGPETISFKLTKADGKPLTGAQIAVEADMSHPGMSPIFTGATEADAGRYQARIVLPMAGDWVVLLHIKLPNGKKLDRQFDVKGVRPN